MTNSCRPALDLRRHDSRLPSCVPPDRLRLTLPCNGVSLFGRLIIVLLTALAPFSALAQGTGDAVAPEKNIPVSKSYYALVVAVSAYDKRPIMSHAVKNARALAAALSRMGFKVATVLDPTSREMKKTFHELVNGPGRDPDQGILFYYVGHGDTQTLSDGSKLGWIVPRDCPPQHTDPAKFTECAVSMKDIAAYSTDMQSRHVLTVFDAAFSETGLSLEPPVLSAPSEKNALPMRRYLIAGHEGETAADQGVFLSYFLKALEGAADVIADGHVTGSELGVYLDNSLRERPGYNRRLQYGALQIPELDRGDFVFPRIGSKNAFATLTIQAEPADARISIRNSKAPFVQGMELKPGKYNVEVIAKGYQRHAGWITLSANEQKTVEVRLKKAGAVITNGIGMKFVLIDPGTFSMGSAAGDAGAQQDEAKHNVTLTGGYYLQTAETTVAQFRQFVMATGYKTEAETGGGCWISAKSGGWKRRKENNWKNAELQAAASFQQTDKRPVTCVSWNDAQAFIQWLSKKEKKSYRLPTEAEWEYACRAGSTAPFAFGKCISSDQANYGGVDGLFSNCKTGYKLSRKKPLPVASLAANAWGLFDMHGNAAEWCNDWYGPYASRAATDPQGPSSGTDRVLRGCHWLNTATECRSAKRSGFPPNYATDVVGFRVVLQL